MSVFSSFIKTTPAHVPQDLVFEYPFVFGKTLKGDPYNEIVPLIHQMPPVFWATNAYPGEGPAWIVRRAEDMRQIYMDTEHFSNRGFAPFAELLEENWHLVPAEMDPPNHAPYRALIFPLFTPAAVRKLDGVLFDYAKEFLAKFKDRGHCEFMHEFAFEFPITVVLQLLALPRENLKVFLEWETDMLHGHNLEMIKSATRKVVDYLRGVISERKKNPGDDVISFALAAKIQDRKFTDDEVLGFAFNLFIGGLDTVSTNLGVQFWHLARHPEHHAYLRSHPEAIPDAIEELLRAYAAVTTFRVCVKETTVNGVHMLPGDKVAMSTTLSCRDPEEFDRPNEVILDRKPKHMGFATGPHLCLGMHLARRELSLAMTEFLKAIPPFRLAPGTKVEFHLGMIQILDLPLVWDV